MESQPIIYTENKPSVTNKVVNCRFIGVMAMTFGQLLRQKLVEKGLNHNGKGDVLKRFQHLPDNIFQLRNILCVVCHIVNLTFLKDHNPISICSL